VIVTLPGPIPEVRLILTQVLGSLAVWTGPAVHGQSGGFVRTDIVALPAAVPKSMLVRSNE